jgi:hypothetical protein
LAAIFWYRPDRDRPVRSRTVGRRSNVSTGFTPYRCARGCTSQTLIAVCGPSATPSWSSCQASMKQHQVDLGKSKATRQHCKGKVN